MGVCLASGVGAQSVDAHAGAESALHPNGLPAAAMPDLIWVVGVAVGGSRARLAVGTLPWCRCSESKQFFDGEALFGGLVAKELANPFSVGIDELLASLCDCQGQGVKLSDAEVTNLHCVSFRAGFLIVAVSAFA